MGEPITGAGKWGRRWQRDAFQAVLKSDSKANNDNNQHLFSICCVLATLLNALFNTFISLTPLNNPRKYVLLLSPFKMEVRTGGEKSPLFTCFPVGRAFLSKGNTL